METPSRPVPTPASLLGGTLDTQRLASIKRWMCFFFITLEPRVE